MLRKSRGKAAWITSKIIQTIGALLALEHGIYEILQGPTKPERVIFNAIGPPCEPPAIWHACLPALTILPDLFLAGIITIILAIATVLTVFIFTPSRQSSILFTFLAIALLLSGGGFVPFFLLIMTAGQSFLSAFEINLSKKNPPIKLLRWIGKSWPWTLYLFLFWYLFPYLFGTPFNELLLRLGGGLFILDLMLPALSLITSSASDFEFISAGKTLL